MLYVLKLWTEPKHLSALPRNSDPQLHSRGTRSAQGLCFKSCNLRELVKLPSSWLRAHERDGLSSARIRHFRREQHHQWRVPKCSKLMIIRIQNILPPTPRWPRLQGQRPCPGPGLEVEPRGPCLGSEEAKARVQELYKLPVNRLCGCYWYCRKENTARGNYSIVEGGYHNEATGLVFVREMLGSRGVKVFGPEAAKRSGGRCKKP